MLKQENQCSDLLLEYLSAVFNAQFEVFYFLLCRQVVGIHQGMFSGIGRFESYCSLADGPNWTYVDLEIRYNLNLNTAEVCKYTSRKHSGFKVVVFSKITKNGVNLYKDIRSRISQIVGGPPNSKEAGGGGSQTYYLVSFRPKLHEDKEICVSLDPDNDTWNAWQVPRELPWSIMTEGRKWYWISGCSTPGRLRMKAPDSIWVVAAAPLWVRNH